jgi:hypothetical protein
MTIHFTRLGASRSEHLKIKSFSIVRNPEYNNTQWVKVTHEDGKEELLCPIFDLHYGY